MTGGSITLLHRPSLTPMYARALNKLFVLQVYVAMILSQNPEGVIRIVSGIIEVWHCTYSPDRTYSFILHRRLKTLKHVLSSRGKDTLCL
jgi:hypothetical protein